MKTTPKTISTKPRVEGFNQAFIDYINLVNQQYGLPKSVHNRLLKLTREIQ